MRYRWQDVDWVELGCRGWDIDNTGAGLDEESHSGSIWNYAHLDRVTGHLILNGYPAFCLRVFLDLRAARVPGYYVEPTAGTTTASANVISGTFVWP